MKILVDYPSAREEVEIVRRMSVAPPVARQVLSREELIALQQAADAVFIHDAIVDYAVRLVLATREPGEHGLSDLAGRISHGVSPRATLGLVAASRALALLPGREFVLPQDVYDVAPGTVLVPRLAPSQDNDVVPGSGYALEEQAS